VRSKMGLKRCSKKYMSSLDDLPIVSGDGSVMIPGPGYVLPEQQHQQQQQQQQQPPFPQTYPQQQPALPPSEEQMISDSRTISDVLNGLYDARLMGSTSLPIRDIPMTTQPHMQDSLSLPSHIPPVQPTRHRPQNYIPEPDPREFMQLKTQPDSLDRIYDAFHVPILLSILYFFFQLPIVRQLIGRYLPMLCHGDGNFRMSGLLFVSALFGMVYYWITVCMHQFSTF